MSGIKHDADKARTDLLPAEALLAVSHVLGHGAKKYAAENWRLVEGGLERYYGAALRHLLAWKRGEETDPDSGLPHLAHAACSVLFMLELGLDEVLPEPSSFFVPAGTAVIKDLPAHARSGQV